jgi:hypothetical protein
MSVNGKHPRASGRVVERLYSFMQAHDLGLEELADFLGTRPHILAQWFNGTAMAPACSLIPLSLVSRLPQARVYPSHNKEEVLRRVQAL